MVIPQFLQNYLLISEKMKRKNFIVSSILTIAMCVSMIVGSTFALFTSESKVNIAVSSGKVEVKASVENFEYKTLTKDWTSVVDNTTEFDGLGGSATLVGDVLTLDKIVPGDAVKFDVKVTNESDVTVKYRTAVRNLSEDATLFNALEVSVNDEDFTFSKISSWAVLDPAVSDVGTISLVIEFPETAEGQELMGKSANILVSVEAIQGNAETSDDALAGTFNEFVNALNSGKPVTLTNDIIVPENVEISANAVVNGQGYSIARTPSIMTFSTETPEIFTGEVFTVSEGCELTLNNVIVDGGAVWGGEVNSVLQRGTVNVGVQATGCLVNVCAGGVLTLGEGAVLQNNDGANAVFLATRAGAKLVIDGGEIINNHSAAGAIWGGGEIVLDGGKVNGNHGGIGGAIRVCYNVGNLLTMNGGEMNYNYSDGNGGAIWAGSSKSNNVYVLNGGEMAYNYSAATGGAIYAGYYETVKIGDTFYMHDNACAADIGAEIRFHDHASLVMTGGKVESVYDNALFLYNNSASITGGEITCDFGYSGGLGLTIGEAEINGVINYSLDTNHNTAYLAETFNGFKFTINESAINFANFNFKPADGYVYTEGDEDKLVCLNDGYSTYWDATTGTFRLQVK